MANIQQTSPPPGSLTEGSEVMTAQPVAGWSQLFLRWARRIKVERTLAILLLVAGMTSGIATFVAMTGNLSVAANADQILLLLLVDLVVILGLAALITRRLAILWIERKKGRAGSRLHGRLVALFSVVAVAPTILVAAFSVIMFDLGLEFWFSERVSTAIKNSRAVAAAYLDEHQQTIRRRCPGDCPGPEQGWGDVGLQSRTLQQHHDQAGEPALFDGGGGLRQLRAHAGPFLELPAGLQSRDSAVGLRAGAE